MELENLDSSILKSNTPKKYPVIEIAEDDMWWQLPKEMSDDLVTRYQANESEIGYTWHWESGSGYTWHGGEQGYGSWRRDNETSTAISKYVMNFETWKQTDIDTQLKRAFRIVWIDLALVQAVKTGESNED